MRSCLTNGVMLTPFSYLGVCKNGLNLGCHTKLNARENRVIIKADRGDSSLREASRNAATHDAELTFGHGDSSPLVDSVTAATHDD